MQINNNNNNNYYYYNAKFRHSLYVSSSANVLISYVFGVGAICMQYAVYSPRVSYSVMPVPFSFQSNIC